MKKHVIALLIGLLALAGAGFGLKSLDGRIAMPLLGGASAQTERGGEGKADASPDGGAKPAEVASPGGAGAAEARI